MQELGLGNGSHPQSQPAARAEGLTKSCTLPKVRTYIWTRTGTQLRSGHSHLCYLSTCLRLQAEIFIKNHKALLTHMVKTLPLYNSPQRNTSWLGTREILWRC